MSRPLDKQEAAFLGGFVGAAYRMFERNPGILLPEPGPNDLPSGYELVAWVVMNDFVFLDKIAKFYGIMARHRERTSEFVVAIRGTEGVVEWLDDAVVRLVPFHQVRHGGRVSQGFDRIYSTLKIFKRHPADDGRFAPRATAEPEAKRESMAGSFAEQLEQLADSLEASHLRQRIRARPEARPVRSCVVTGHSLGAALATLFVMENEEKRKFNVSTLCTFASPRVGNSEFVRRFNKMPITSWRIVNSRDIVPRLPFHIPVLLDYQHVAVSHKFSSAGTVKWNPACWHSMSTYLHWLGSATQIDAARKG
jgi:predicted lipase